MTRNILALRAARSSAWFSIARNAAMRLPAQMWRTLPALRAAIEAREDH